MSTVVFLLAVLATAASIVSVLFVAAGRIRDAAALIGASVGLLLASVSLAYVLQLGV